MSGFLKIIKICCCLPSKARARIAWQEQWDKAQQIDLSCAACGGRIEGCSILEEDLAKVAEIPGNKKQFELKRGRLRIVEATFN